MTAIRTFTSLIAFSLALLPMTVGAQQHFPSPEAAARAFEAAAKSNDAQALVPILGPEGDKIVSSGDPVDDAAARKRFAKRAAERSRVEHEADSAIAVWYVGHDAWPLPIPIVRDAEGWRFDAAAGKEELLNRRIGRNELTVLAVCRAYVDAQREYAKRFHTFAQTVRSTPGKQDGLYWEAADREASPFGPLVASATAEGYHVGGADEPMAPYHGYFFRVLKAQGAHAPDGAKDYVSNGQMTAGFALLAWPAEHGSSGVMTFVVGPQGVVFQKDLGAGTTDAVKAITAYDPDESWQPTR